MNTLGIVSAVGPVAEVCVSLQPLRAEIQLLGVRSSLGVKYSRCIDDFLVVPEWGPLGGSVPELESGMVSRQR